MPTHRFLTPSRTINLFRVLFIVFGLFVGMRVGDVIFDSLWVGAVSGLIFGLGIVLADRLLRGFSLRMFSAATLGLLLGLAASRLLMASDVLRYTTEQTRWAIGLTIYAALGYLGTMLAMRSNRDEFSLLIPYVRFRRTGYEEPPVIVDTNILIDGRLTSVVASGFVSPSLVIPRFVLDELQMLADSSDPLKRARGQRGLSLLQEARTRPGVSITIHESAPSETEISVDNRLIRTAQFFQAKLLTNDSNLAHIARLEGVSTLSLNELSEALAPALETGDETDLMLVKPGRDPHQAVGYLADGRMIVVNQARAHVGSKVRIVIAGRLQTATGQMYFAELKNLDTPAAPPYKR